MGMTTQEFTTLLSVFRNQGLDLFPHPLSGHELRRTKAAMVHHTGIFIGRDSKGIDWVIDHSPGGVQWKRYEQYRDGEHVTCTPPALGPAQSVVNAISQVGKLNYSLSFMNCQHFSTWAAHGKSFSSAVQTVGLVAAIGIVTALVFGQTDDRRLFTTK